MRAHQRQPPGKEQELAVPPSAHPTGHYGGNSCVQRCWLLAQDLGSVTVPLWAGVAMQ